MKPPIKSAPVEKVAQPATEEVVYLRRRLRDIEGELESYRMAHGSIEELARDLRQAVTVCDPVKIVAPRKARKQSATVAAIDHHTDTHMGAVQVRDEIEGFDEFSPEILERGMARYNAAFLSWVDDHRHSNAVDEVVIPCTGDLISGDIHDELRATNAFPPPVQVVRAAYLLRDKVMTYAPHFERVRVEFVVADNHGRLTKKPQAKEGGINSLNYLVGVIAQQAVSGQKNVTFNIHPQIQTTVVVKGRRYLLLHGHGIYGVAGIPYYGAERRVGKEAIKRMVKKIGAFDRMVMGHFHAPLAHPTFWIGGSAQGTDAYDHSCGRYSEPCQSAWMVHPDKGEYDRTDFRLER